MHHLISTFSNFWQKICLSIPLCLVCLREEDVLIIFCLILIVIVDTILGIMVAIKHKIFSSHKLKGLVYKTITYALYMATFWILHCVDPFLLGWTFKYFGMVLIITEVSSNLEKLSLLDVKIPLKALSKLNKHFKEYQDSPKDKKEEAAEVIFDKKKNNK